MIFWVQIYILWSSIFFSIPHLVPCTVIIYLYEFPVVRASVRASWHLESSATLLLLPFYSLNAPPPTPLKTRVCIKRLRKTPSTACPLGLGGVPEQGSGISSFPKSWTLLHGKIKTFFFSQFLKIKNDNARHSESN